MSYTSNKAKSIAHKLRSGMDNGGIQRDALAVWVDWVAESLETNDSIIEKLQRENAALKQLLINRSKNG